MYNPYLTEESFLVATKCCLKKDDKILIVWENRHGKPLWWELPGGKISKADQDLSPIESLARELWEELGNDFGILEGDGELFMAYKSYEDTTFSDSKVPFIFLCYVYEIPQEHTIILSHEHTEFQWISLDEIEKIEGWRNGFDTIVRNAFLFKNSEKIEK